MSRHYTPPSSSRNDATGLAVVSGIAGMLFGIIVGYLLAAQPGRIGAPVAAGTVQPIAAPGTVEPVAAPGGTNAPASAVVNDQELQAYRDILKADPKNVRAATELGNKLYDAGRYSEAIIYYEMAFKLDPKNINISTDLGTALWYSGKPDEALAQFDKSLAINPKHPQTLFNRGIVRMEGKKDPAAALKSWEELQSADPTYETLRVRNFIENAKRQLGTAAAVPVRN